MALFPFFRDIKDKTVMVVGSGKEAESKCAKLAPYGAKIVRMTEDEFLGNRGTAAQLADIAPVCIIAAGEDREINRRIAVMCRERGILVNTVDDPEYCDFVFPSLISRGNLSVGICTGGASPSIGMLLKQKVEEQIPEHMEEILDWLQEVRPVIAESVPDKKQRFLLFHRMAEMCMDLGRPMTEKELADLLEIRR